MQKPTIAQYLHGQLRELRGKKEAGPFVTISRQPGCEGYKVGDLLLEMLNKADRQQRWRLYKKEILKQLAEDSALTEEVIERERYNKPSLLKDFFKGLQASKIPDGYEIRSKITTMVRTVAFQGHAIIIGQGATAATADFANGLSVRLEAPKDWRMNRVCIRDNLSAKDALAKIEEEEKKRAHLRKINEQKNPRSPAFNLVFDNSVLEAEQIAGLVFHAMEQKNMTQPLKQQP
jgi:cytidylate kinase